MLPDSPLFVPDLPGYGLSAPPDQHDKVSVGHLLISALKGLLDPQTAPPVILIGHDRGARVAHALHVATGSSVQGLPIIGLGLLDIVPTSSQWQNGGSAANQVGTFHWSFLANVAISIPMIMAYGGGKWAETLIDRWAGKNEDGLRRLRSGDAVSVYKEFFDKESVVEATCRDYEAGATVDVETQTQANESGKAITVPLLLIYSGGFLKNRARKPIEEVWGPPWTADVKLITSVPIGDGVGHFVAEEAPEETAEALRNWLSSLK